MIDRGIDLKPLSPLQRFYKSVDQGSTNRRGRLLQQGDEAKKRFNTALEGFSTTLQDTTQQNSDQRYRQIIEQMLQNGRVVDGLKTRHDDPPGPYGPQPRPSPSSQPLPGGRIISLPMPRHDMTPNGDAIDYRNMGLDPDAVWLIDRESDGHFRGPNADNDTSSAFGVGQLILSNRQHYGQQLGFDPNTEDPMEQLQMFQAYVMDRYGSYANARRFWEQNGWY